MVISFNFCFFWFIFKNLDVFDFHADILLYDKSIVFLFFLKNLQQIQNFGEPFFLVIHEGETLDEIKVRIQKKLQVPDDEFCKVISRVIFLCPSF